VCRNPSINRRSLSLHLLSPLPPPLSQSPQLLSIPQFYFPQLGPQPEVQRAAEERLMALLGAHPQVTTMLVCN